MQVKATVTVTDGERSARVDLDVESGSAYGQNPVVGATEKVLASVPPIVRALAGK
jgi:hypothetical protein